MPEASEPVLVYARIAENVRKTRLLMASFVILLTPVVSGGTVLILPVASITASIVAYLVFGPESIQRRVDSISAELDAIRPTEGVVQLEDLPSSVVWLTGGLVSAALVIFTLGFVVATAFLISRYGSRMLLRAAHARRVGAAEEPDLVRAIENLSIGAGLPTPSVYIIESPAPNAFATGRDPQDASLVVTRGLLTLVNRRELQAVIAHELSHIGNQDTRLTTLVGALVATTSLPLRICLAPIGFAFRIHRGLGLIGAFMALLVGVQALAVFSLSVTALASEEAWRVLPAFMWWWVAHATFTPAYALVVAPVMALFIRQAVSRQREFLADADAVRLTRDPEGLALALAKIGSASGERLRVGEGGVHLYIVDPKGGQSLLHRIFPSHPPLNDRIELLARMGSGIPQASLDAAIEAGKQVQQTILRTEVVSVKQIVSDDAPASPPQASKSSRATVPLYEKPDGWSNVLIQLDKNAALTTVGREGTFVRVVTADNIRGYVSSSADLAALRQALDGSAETCPD